MMGEGGEGSEMISEQIKPSWDNTPGILTLKFGNQIARKVRPIAINVIKVLDEFERWKWRSYIDYPLADPKAPSKDPQRFHETIKSLNRGLSYIEFHADGTGKRITWRPKHILNSKKAGVVRRRNRRGALK